MSLDKEIRRITWFSGAVISVLRCFLAVIDPQDHMVWRFAPGEILGEKTDTMPCP
jgi:hypothetical protein